MQFRHFVKLAIKIADCRWWWARFAVTCSHLTNLTSGQGFHKLCWNAWMKAEARITPYNLTLDSWRCRFKVLLTPYYKSVWVCVSVTHFLSFSFSFSQGQPRSISHFSVHPSSVRVCVNFFQASDWSIMGTLHRREGHWRGWVLQRQLICGFKNTKHITKGWAEPCHTQNYMRLKLFQFLVCWPSVW